MTRATAVMESAAAALYSYGGTKIGRLAVMGVTARPLQ